MAAKSAQKSLEKHPVKPAVILTVPIHPELKRLVGDAAEQHGLSMNEWVAQILAAALQRPELGKVPRLPLGRRRSQAVA